MFAKTFAGLLTASLLLVAPAALANKKVSKACTFKGKKLMGKVKIVDNFPDFKVQVVKNFPDLKVKKVDNFPNQCGKWKLVKNFPDFKIKLVKNFPDFKIKWVKNFPGVP